MVGAVTIVSLVVETLLLSLRVSLICVVVRQVVRKNRAYSSAFFMIFVCQSFVDCISYCFVGYLEQWQALPLCEGHAFQGSLTFRLLQNGLLPPQWFDTAMVGKLVFFLASFGSFFEFTAHVTIATNRFTAIVCPIQHSKASNAHTSWHTLYLGVEREVPGAHYKLRFPGSTSFCFH